ncbi:nuclease-related domain-containing protein [Deinococcus sp. QL22]|uniref:nuclease-related domain-containing protein n=1 Tax=Deinococcus sp. QL22 TaxID=2939437 RepID=UPI0020176087|nr:NERD domain-containing protein [Deinococcus sp. QL22]UQN06284.1 NERD domain-containing protein [Deinococcus sp. QL22]
MIAKEYAPLPTADRFQKAGDEAERQMAHYLKRAFGDDPDVQVFNNLRLEHGGEVAQIDHLIFHRAGLIVIESKSVTSAVRINDREEWARQWNGQWRGMPSPILQARRQGDLLRALLQANKEELRNKILLGLKQGGFKAFMIDVVVGISDSGVVEYKGALPDVKKADQVPDRVKELIADHQQLARPFSRDKRAEQWGFNISPEEVVRITAFLRAKHRDRPATAAVPEPLPAAPLPQAVPVTAPESPSSTTRIECSKCKSQNLEIKFGHSYYFKCRSCEANTSIKLSCPKCSTPGRLRKSGAQFYAECPSCKFSALYFTNP